MVTSPFAKASLLVGLVVVLSGCVQTKATMLSAKEYPPIDPSEVTIYLSEDDVPGRFERVALITSSGSTQYTRQDQMYESIRKKAAEIGANGVLFSEINEPSTGAKIAGAFLGTGSSRNSEMVAIYVFVEEPAAAEAPEASDSDADPDDGM